MLPQVTQTFIMNSAEIFELASLDKRGFIIVASRPSSPADRDLARRGSQSGRKKGREESFLVAGRKSPVLENGSHSCVF